LATDPAQPVEAIQKMRDAPSGRPDNLRQFGVGRIPRQPNPARGGAGGRQPGQRERQSPFGGLGHKVSDSFFVAIQPQREILQDPLREATVSAQALEEPRFAKDDYFYSGYSIDSSSAICCGSGPWKTTPLLWPNWRPDLEPRRGVETIW